MVSEPLRRPCRISPAAALALAAALAVLLLALPAVAEGVGQMFNRAHTDFHALRQNTSQARYRSNWLHVEQEFSAVLTADPDGAYAPKALYYLGRVYEELGYRSGLDADFMKAVDYFERVVRRFPHHAWADDCLYRAADLRSERLNQHTFAIRDLRTLLNDYPDGDMTDEARVLLAELEAEHPSSRDRADQIIEDLASSRASTPPPEPEPAPAPAPEPHVPVAEAQPVPDDAVTASADSPAKLAQVRFTSSSDYTRVVLDLDEVVRYRYQLLPPAPEHERSHRLYIDLVDTHIGPEVQRSTDVANGILRSIRSAQRDTETTRVVLDFVELQDYKIFYLTNPFRIVIDVFAPQGGAASTAGTVADMDTPHDSNLAADLVEQLGLTIHTIMIDAGHGGHDPGAVHGGVREKDINLRMAKIVGQMLAERGFNVLYTRTDDTFISLDERIAMANAQRADMFVSLHCNAHRSSRINGLETYSLNLARTQDAVRVAARENAVDAHQISDLQVILTDLMLSSKVKESSELAASIQTTTISTVRPHYSINDHGAREAPFYVLMGAKMPAVLVEMGYMTNGDEARRLNSDAYLRVLAQGIVNGIVAYKEQIERFASI